MTVSVSDYVSHSQGVIEVNARRIRLDVDTIIQIVTPLSDWRWGARINHTRGLVHFYPVRGTAVNEYGVRQQNQKLCESIATALETSWRERKFAHVNIEHIVKYDGGRQYRVLPLAMLKLDEHDLRAVCATIRSRSKVRSVTIDHGVIVVTTQVARQDLALMEDLRRVLLHKACVVQHA